MRYLLLTKSLLLLWVCLGLMAACAPTGIYHTVQPGQTLYRIALTYDIDERRLADINGIKDPTQLKTSQRLFIPGVTQVRRVPATAASAPANAAAPGPPPAATTVAPGAAAPAADRAEARKPATSPPPPGKVKDSRPAPAASAAKPAKGIFIWPVKGTVLNRFGTQGQKVYKGIEIGVAKGTTVVAAASGKVIYSGNGIPGYGNLVILEHSDSFFSVYGFNEKTLVKMNDYVGQGDKIALSGLPPSGQSARLHFEIRKGKSAVNPILYLP